MPPFHLAFPVRDLAEAKSFYHDFLGCPIGRQSEEWVDFNFHGHQIVAHLAPELVAEVSTNNVDGEDVPVRHFGALLSKDAWQALADKIKASPYNFLIAPTIRFENKPGEQGTFFILDPSHNALEFKYFAQSEDTFRPFGR